MRGFHFVGPALFLDGSKTLIFSDVHFGAEAVLVGKGVLLPKRQKKETIVLLKPKFDS